MAQKKKKQRPPTQAKQAAEPVYAEKMEPRARVLLALSIVVIILSFVIMARPCIIGCRLLLMAVWHFAAH